MCRLRTRLLRPEAISFVATTEGIKGEDVRDLMTVAVETRFGSVNRLPDAIEWLSDNGSGYIASETRRFAREIGLEPLTTPVQSPQSNGMAEAFVRTIKRDYARINPMPNAAIVMRSCRHGSITTTGFTLTRRSDTVRRESSSQTIQPRRACPVFKGNNRPPER